jgi:hypothetical protein
MGKHIWPLDRVKPKFFSLKVRQNQMLRTSSKLSSLKVRRNQILRTKSKLNMDLTL